MLEGRELIPRKTFSRRQALGLLGGSLAGATLLSLGLAAPAKGGLPNPYYNVVGPGTSRQPHLSAVRQGRWYDMTVEWRIVFDPRVVNHRFGTRWQLKEDDDVGYDDTISATVEPFPHSSYSPTKYFTPSQANPSNPREVSFKETIGWHEDDLDTELGGEELYAIVYARNITLKHVNGTSGSTQELPLSP